MSRKFFTLDVFTHTPFAGNPLAVVLNAEGLDSKAMQAIATEFNLSETVFVLPPEEANNRASIRIFTPVHELPFAGHPTVGTAILLNHLDGGEPNTLVLEEKVGPVECAISIGPGGKVARFGLPKKSLAVDWEFDTGLLAEALNLKESALEFGEHKIGVWDGGVPYTLVPVKSLQDVENVSVDTAKLRQVEPIIGEIAANMYVYCAGGTTNEADFHARMFAPLFGIPEDPATGSAVASLSGALAAAEMNENDARHFHIEQGYEMGRPSQILLDMKKQNGSIVDAGISGGAVIISEGMLHA